MPDMDLTPYVEVQQVRLTDVNKYLKHGYALLGFNPYAQSAVHGEVKKGGSVNPHMYYTRRGVLYIVGRTAEVDSWSPDSQDKNNQEAAP